MWKKLINNIESYYRLFTLRILTLSIISKRKIVDSSLKNRNIRIRRSEFFD